MFKDRFDAANRLVAGLKHYQNSDAVILAIPRGGIEIGYILAIQLGLPLNVILIKKLGHPANKELAIGAVSQYGSIVNPDYGISNDYIRQEVLSLQNIISKQSKVYEELSTPHQLENKVVILTDDGIATGFTIFTAIDIIKKNHPSKIVVAVPVAPKHTLDKISERVDEVICDRVPFAFHAVGEFYESFEQVSDERAMELLQKANKSHIET